MQKNFAAAITTFVALKQIVVTLFSLLMLSQAFVRTFWALDYQWRRAVYMKKCENKDRPELKCDGKCYLNKQMSSAKSEVQNEEAPMLPESFRQIKEALLFFEPVLELQCFLITFDKPSPAPFKEGLLPNPHPDRVFRPPADLDV